MYLTPQWLLGQDRAERYVPGTSPVWCTAIPDLTESHGTALRTPLDLRPAEIGGHMGQDKRFIEQRQRSYAQQARVPRKAKIEWTEGIAVLTFLVVLGALILFFIALAAS